MTVCIIPARFQSTRLPGKLLKTAGGQTVLQRTWLAAKRASAIDEVFVATDDPRIADHVSSLGGSVLWTSPSCKSGSERIAEAVETHPELRQAEIVVNLQGDHPLTAPETLDRVASLLREDAAADVATAVKRIEDAASLASPHAVKCVLGLGNQALYFSRSPIPHGQGPHYQHIGIYAYRTPFLLKLRSLPDTPNQLSEDLEQLKFLELGYRIAAALVEDCALGVDTPQDLATLEHHLSLCPSNTYS